MIIINKTDDEVLIIWNTVYKGPRLEKARNENLLHSGPETFLGLEASRFSSKIYSYIGRANIGATRDLKYTTLSLNRTYSILYQFLQLAPEGTMLSACKKN